VSKNTFPERLSSLVSLDQILTEARS